MTQWLATLLALALSSTVAVAQEKYPSRPVTLVVGFAAGGAGDVVTRFIADAAKEKLGQAVVVENKPGAGATLAAGQVARAKPDGYTLMLATTSPFTVTPHFQTVQYDPQKDFTYVLQYLVTPTPAFVKSDSPFKKWQDVIEFARANPGKLRWGTAAPRGGAHIGTEAALRKLGLKTTFAPFTGGAEAITALLGGHIEMVVSSDYGPLLDAGQVRVLVESGPDKIPGLSEVPTFTELGYPLAVPIFYGLAGPAGLTPEVVATWERAMKEIMATPAWADLMKRYRASSSFRSSREFTESVTGAHREIGRLVVEIGMKPR